MRLGGRMAAAIEILEAVETRHRPVSEALKEWGISHRFAGSGDRAAIGNLVYDAMRCRASNAAAAGDTSARAAVFAVVLRQWGMEAEELAGTLSGDSHAPVCPDLRGLASISAADLSGEPDHVRADCPEWLMQAFGTVFDGDAVAELQAMTVRAPLDIRANTLKTTRDKLARALARDNPQVLELPDTALRFPAHSGHARLPNVTADPSFARGWFEVQDAGSQIVSQLTGVSEGEQVLDYCAGGGGKTLALSALMANTGQIHAYDSDRSRLSPAVERLKRAGTRNVQLHADEAALEPLTSRMDCVLVDAPCTGTGTWRRRPDTKWKLSPQNLEARMADQDAVLDAAAGYVRPGGRLVYITCSLLPQENDDRVAAFLARSEGFEAVPPDEIWRVAFGGLAAAYIPGKSGLMLTPRVSGTDGFYCSVLKRRS